LQYNRIFKKCKKILFQSRMETILLKMTKVRVKSRKRQQLKKAMKSWNNFKLEIKL